MEAVDELVLTDKIRNHPKYFEEDLNGWLILSKIIWFSVDLKIFFL